MNETQSDLSRAGSNRRLKLIQDALKPTSKSQTERIQGVPRPGASMRLKSIQDALSVSMPTGNVPAISLKRRALSHEPSKSPKITRTSDSWNTRNTSIDPAHDCTSPFREITMAPPEVLPVAESPSHSGPMTLTPEQMQIFKLVLEGESMFYTGSAGTGKSVLLKEIIIALRTKFADAVAVTAATGVAANNIGGVTVHSFAGIGFGGEKASALVKKIMNNEQASARWQRTKVLIIDEVSMIDGDLFDKLSAIGSRLRNMLDTPFGGIQLIITGDFFQLPPVRKGTAPIKFAFEAKMWNQAVKHSYNLTKVFRQRDPEFVDMLSEMRFGRLSQQSIIKFQKLSREVHYEDGICPTELFPRREDVDQSNSLHMSHLPSEDHLFFACDGGSLKSTEQRAQILSKFMAPEVLCVRLNAQVMLIKSIDETLVNGTIGRVVQIVDSARWENDLGGDHGTARPVAKAGGHDERSKVELGGYLCPVVEFVTGTHSTPRRVLIVPRTWTREAPDGEVLVSRTQYPLILSWAMSIHKCQGQTLDRVKVDLGKVFETGQAYVALSRATSLSGLQVLNFDAGKVRAHKKVVEWSRTLQTVSSE